MYYWEIKKNYVKRYAYGDTFEQACANLGLDWMDCSGKRVY